MSEGENKSNFFRNCDKPTLEPVEGEVKGTIPTWLNGTLYRNGPGIQKVGPDHYKHFFDGLAVIHRFHIVDGKITYNNRPLESDSYRTNMAAERIVVSEFGTYGVGDPCDTMFNKFKSLFVFGGSKDKSAAKEKITDNCLINVGHFGDELFAMTESMFIRRVDPTTLKTIGSKTRLADYLAVSQATAHPHVLEDGTVLNVGNNYYHKKGTHYCIVSIPPTFDSNDSSGFKNAKIIAEIPARWKYYPGYVHSFGMTTDKIIFIEQPYCFKIPKMIIQPLTHCSYRDCLGWYPNQKTKIYVVSMSTGEIHPIVYETDNLFTFHHCNAYEENGQIVVDVAGYNDGNFISYSVDRDTMREHSQDPKHMLTGTSARRYVLPLTKPEKIEDDNQNLVTLENTKAQATIRKNDDKIIDLTPEILYPEWFEFPRINYKYNGKKHKYIYGATSSKERSNVSVFPEPDNLTKLDTTKTGKNMFWHEAGIIASEPVFVPNPTIENPEEDDGVLLAALLYEKDQFKTTLLVLDAKDMKELGRVEFKANGPVPTTFHGQWAGTAEKVHFY